MKKAHTQIAELDNLELHSQALIIGDIIMMDSEKNLLTIIDSSRAITIPISKSRIDEVKDFDSRKNIEIKVQVRAKRPLTLHIMRISQGD